MDPKSNAEKVATIAREYAHRRRHHIDHTGHTVHRLLDAVSALLGRKVIIHEADRVPPATARDA